MGHMDLPSGEKLAHDVERDMKKGNLEGVAHELGDIDHAIRILKENSAYTPEMQKQVQQMMKSCNEQLHRDGVLPGLELTGQQGGNLSLIDKQHKQEYVMHSGKTSPSLEEQRKDSGYGYGDKSANVTYGPVQVERKTDKYHDPVSKAYLNLPEK